MEIKNTFFLVLVASIGLLQAQYTAIPDTCFEQHLVDLGIDSDGVINGQVLTADIANVTSLTMNGYDEINDVYYCYIDSLQGIDDFIALETLNINYNGVQYIDLSNLPNLKNLYCDNNYTQTLALPPSIEIVYARYNRFSQNIDLSQTINLKEFYIAGLPYITGYPSYSHVTSLDLSNCSVLTKLDIGYNDFTSIDISNNPLLIELTIFVNQINTFTHNNNINLEYLKASFNNLNTIDLTNLTGLKYISLGGNEIETIDLSQNPNLEKIAVDFSNTLTSLDIRNGHNNLVTKLWARYSPNLTCIYVDDEQYSTTNWTYYMDSNSTFVETEAECESLGNTETILEDEFKVYPNPVKNKLSIKSKNLDIRQVTVFDMLGKEIINTTNTTIDFSTLENGLYLIKIKTSNNTIFTKKIIKIGT